MYLLNKDAEIFSEPWPHAIINDALPIEIADHLRDNFPEHRLFSGPNNSDEIFAEFSDVNFNIMADDIVAKCHDLMKVPYSECELDEISFINYKYDNVELIRDWHLDGASKKFQMLYYLGESEAGGEIELTNGKDIKTLPYQHNRLFIWQNAPGTLHRFWSVNGSRKTISFVINMPM